MSASPDPSSLKTASADSRTGGFVLGANWERPQPATPVSGETDPRPPAVLMENAPAILQGIITHFVEPELRPKLKQSSDSLRLIEDLGLDSLTMIEVMLRVEDLLKIRVSDAELRHFRTLGEVRQFVDHTARGMSVELPAH